VYIQTRLTPAKVKMATRWGNRPRLPLAGRWARWQGGFRSPLAGRGLPWVRSPLTGRGLLVSAEIRDVAGEQWNQTMNLHWFHQIQAIWRCLRARVTLDNTCPSWEEQDTTHRNI